MEIHKDVHKLMAFSRCIPLTTCTECDAVLCVAKEDCSCVNAMVAVGTVVKSARGKIVVSDCISYVLAITTLIEREQRKKGKEERGRFC